MRAYRLLLESASWLNCPFCGSSNTDILGTTKEIEPFKDFEAVEDTKNADFEHGTKEQDIIKYTCFDCGRVFTKTDVDIKYSKTEK